MSNKEESNASKGDRDRYRAIFEKSLTANFVISDDGEIVDANKAACQMFGYSCDQLIGKTVDSLFDANGMMENLRKSETFSGHAIGLKADGTRMVCDCYYSVFKTNSGSKFSTLQVNDNTEQSRETENLKLFESVVKGASDAVIIIKSRPSGRSSAADIIFVNKAYTELTGYNFDELMGEQAKFLNAPKSSRRDLARLRNAIEKNEPIEMELLTYKKNGDEFWVHVTISPVFDGDVCTHFIAIAKDITDRKNREQLKSVQSEISSIFNNYKTLSDCADKTLEVLVDLGDFSLAELWQTDNEKGAISLFRYKAINEQAKSFYEQCSDIKTFTKGEGLPGITWKKGTIQFWRELENRKDFVRQKEAAAAGFHTAYGIPINFDDSVTGVLVLGVLHDQKKQRYYTPLLELIADELGTEIDRKKTEEQLDRIFSFSPDIICVAGMDGYFKQINPAMSRILGFSRDELLTQPISSFTHPDDRLKTENEIDALNKNEGANTFQNRYITKSGKVVWLSWTTRTYAEEGNIYSVARDVTEQKELEILLRQANRMSKIGAWEYDVVEEKVTWSDVVREIHQVPEEFDPNLKEGLHFYREGFSRDTITEKLAKAIEKGQSFDVELQLVTGKGNLKWVRVIGEADVVHGRVKKIYGSFQDIDQLKIAELKQQELALERERILESIGDGFFTVDKDFIVTYWNSKAEGMLGVSTEEAMFKNLWDLFPDARKLKSYDQYHLAMNEGRNVSFEDFYEPLGKWFEINAYSYGQGLSVFFKDITKRKVAEQRIQEKTRRLDAIASFNSLLIKHDHWADALQESFATFGKVVDANRVYFFQNEYDRTIKENKATLRFEWFNNEVEKRADINKNESIPFSILGEFLEKLQNNEVYSSFVDQMKDHEFGRRLKDSGIESILAIPVFVGSRFYGCIGFDECSYKRTWSDEEVKFLKTIVLNLASAIESEEAEEAVQIALKEKNEILESITDAFFAVDKNWTVNYWNNMAEEFLGVGREDIVGKHLWDVFDDAVKLDFYKQYHKAMREQVTVSFEEFYPGVEKWFEVTAYPSSDGLSIFFKDVTHRKITEERMQELNSALKKQTEELKASNKELEQFAFVASHDLQEPLRMVTSFLTQLEKKYGDELDEKAKKYIWFATDGAKRMRQIILGLLNYSRIGRAETTFEPVDLNTVIKAVLRDYSKVIEETNADIQHENLPVITADYSSIQSLMSNLIGNALKYQPVDNQPKILVKGEETEDSFKVSVTDNGIGISPEYREKIFQIFQRLHSNEEYSGTGIGLAICRKILEHHNGTIEVQSSEGEGSTFVFEIPKLTSIGT